MERGRFDVNGVPGQIRFSHEIIPLYRRDNASPIRAFMVMERGRG
jgi:hypothetical protein